MARKRVRTVDRSSAPKYAQVAAAFLVSAEALATLAGDDEGYGNAIALLSTHAVIAWADAVCPFVTRRRKPLTATTRLLQPCCGTPSATT